MKNLLMIILILSVIFGCSEKKDTIFGPNPYEYAPTQLQIQRLNPITVKLTWVDNSSNEDGFRIDRKEGYNDWQTKYYITKADSNSFIDTDLEPNSYYIYRVYAIKGNRKTAFCESSINMEFEGPTNLVIEQINIHSVELTWQDNSSEETDYRIDRRREDEEYQEFFQILPENSINLIDTTVLPSYKYYFRVFAIYDTAYSEFAVEDITPTIIPPDNLQAEQISINSVQLTWNDLNSEVSGFKIERAIADSEFEEYAFLPPDEAAFIDTDLIPNTNYTYRVYAMWDSILSDISQVSMTPTIIPPDNLQAEQISINSVQLTWNDLNLGESGFKIERAVADSEFEEYAFLPSEETDFIDNSINLYNQYYYRVYVMWNSLQSEYSQISIATNPLTIGSCDTNEALAVYIKDNYAYVADNDEGLKVIDITNPSLPFIIGNCHYGVQSVFVLDYYAYIAAPIYDLGPNAFHIVDITNPSLPYITGSCYTVGDEGSVYVEENYAYVACYTSGLRVFDITNPGIPTVIGSCDTNEAYGVYVKENYAYVADEEEGLKVIDVTNPALPSIVGSCDTYNAHSVFVKDNYAYVADKEEGLKVIDVTNPETPTVIGSCDTYRAYGVYVKENYAYVADDNEGLKVIDITNPALPSIVGSCDTYKALGIYVKDNYAYVADYYEGLKIIQIAE